MNRNIFQPSKMKIQTHGESMRYLQMSDRYFSLPNYNYQIVLLFALAHSIFIGTRSHLINRILVQSPPLKPGGIKRWVRDSTRPVS
jgi:hypothetical protein